MRLTRRGWAVVGFVVLIVALGWQFGSRSLNAIAAPLVGALLVGSLQVFWADRPEVNLRAPDAGFPDEHRTVSVEVGGSGLAVVDISMPSGTSAERIETAVSLPESFEQRIELEARGVHRLGPVRLTQRDALGLVERRADDPAETDLVIYPRRYDVPPESTLARLFDDHLETERQEFDRLREYVPGDPLRHVHWKSSAKHDDFLVMEFAPTERTDTVTVAATSETETADDMASGALAVAELALDAGLEVKLVVGEETLPPGSGGSHREAVRRLLARAAGGDVPDDSLEQSDVFVRQTTDGTTVRVGGRDHDLQALVRRQQRREEVPV